MEARDQPRNLLHGAKHELSHQAVVPDANIRQGFQMFVKVQMLFFGTFEAEANSQGVKTVSYIACNIPRPAVTFQTMNCGLPDT